MMATGCYRVSKRLLLVDESPWNHSANHAYHGANHANYRTNIQGENIHARCVWGSGIKVGGGSWTITRG
jgi:hypothetical protein